MIEVFAPVTETDAYGSSVTTWESRGRWHAERVRYAGRLSEEGNERFADFSIRWNIRIEHHCEEHWQVDGEDGRRYEIVAIEPAYWLGMQTLVCERINP